MRNPPVWVVGVCCCCLFLTRPATAAWPVQVDSPDGRVRASVHADADGRLRLDVSRDAASIIANAALGIVVDGKDLGLKSMPGEVTRRTIDESRPLMGAHATAVDRCVESTFAFTSGDGHVPWLLEVRAYDDGVAYRYRVPGTGPRRVNGESGSWTLPADAVVNFQPHNPRKDYEARYARGRIDALPRMLAAKPSTRPTTAPASTQPARNVIATPATFEMPSGGYVMLTEANLIDYSDMALEHASDGTFRTFFHNQPDGWDWTGEVVSPWRVMLVASDLDALVNSDLVQNLCPPPSPALANASWIRPGRSTWHWMVSGRPKFADQRGWVDRTRDLGFEYYLIDDGWKQWKDGDRDAWTCMKDVVDYARSQNVAIWAWVDSKDIRYEPARDAWFAKARASGVVGVKVDFMKAADVEWVQWYDDTLRDAAEHELMINFHGSLKPSGRERTWPHNLTREAVKGREGGKQPIEHDAILPFVRYVQGAADYTPTDFRPDKLKGSSYAHELAQAVLFTTPFLCYGGDPANYLENEAVDLIKSIPATWDETRVLSFTKIGEVAAFARRKGDVWYVAVMNGRAIGELQIALPFLGDGAYRAEVFGDQPDRPDAWLRQERNVLKQDRLKVSLRDDGGVVIRLTPVR